MNETGFLPAKCTQCGAELIVDPKLEKAYCQYCGTPFVTSKAINNYNYNTNNTTYNITNNSKKGVVESVLGYASERREQNHRWQEEKRIRDEQEAAKARKTALWVIGWIIFFPIPLTILITRSVSIPQKVKYALLSVLWIPRIALSVRQYINRDNTPKPKDIKMPQASSEYVDESYKKVEDVMKSLGFTNIRTEPLGDLKLGILSTEDEVESIYINGDPEFRKGERFPLDSEVIIYYHSFKDDSSLPEEPEISA